MSEPVDVVYTWVNGSDPEFLRSLKETDLGLETNSLDISPQRYKGLLYSFHFLFDNEISTYLNFKISIN